MVWLWAPGGGAWRGAAGSGRVGVRNPASEERPTDLNFEQRLEVLELNVGRHVQVEQVTFLVGH